MLDDVSVLIDDAARGEALVGAAVYRRGTDVDLCDVGGEARRGRAGGILDGRQL